MSRVWPASSIRKYCRAHSHLAWMLCSTWRTCRLCWQALPQLVLRSLSAPHTAKTVRLTSEYVVLLTMHAGVQIDRGVTGHIWPCRIPT